jgi:hypothetical protein
MKVNVRGAGGMEAVGVFVICRIKPAGIDLITKAGGSSAFG